MMEPNMKRLISAIALFLWLPGLLFCRTRQDVIADANVYSIHPWTPQEKNLLDRNTYSQNAITGEWSVIQSTDGIDDRAQKYTDRYGNIHYSALGNPAGWPFFYGQGVSGEAYAWAGYSSAGLWGADTTTQFSVRLSSISTKWIAGKSDVDLLPASHVGFTGLDCSGLAGNALDINRFAADGYKLNALQMADYSVLTGTSGLKPGDFLDRIILVNGEKRGRHVIVVKEVYSSSVAVYHATPYSFFTGVHVRRAIEETIRMRGGDDGLIYLQDAYYNNSEFYYYPYSPFPQFKWSSPAVDYAVLDVVDHAVALRIDSARALTKVDITLDPGMPSSATAMMINDGLYLTTVPASTGKGYEVRWQLPASYVLAEGTHTLVAYAINELGLEDWATTYFYVGSDNAPPAIAWTDMVNLVSTTGYASGLRAIADGPWFHGDTLKLDLSDYQSPLSSFTIFSSTGGLAYHKDFYEGTKSAGVSDAIEHLADGTAYRALLSDRLGNGTTLYFHIDRSTPLVAISGIISRLKPDNSGHIFDISGTASDAVSGLGGPVLNLGGAAPVGAAYAGVAWPPGPVLPESEPFSFSGSTDSRKLAVFDRAGWLGVNTLGISTMTNYAHLDHPGTIYYYEQSGLILKYAAVTLSVPANIRLLDEPEGTVVTVSVYSAAPPADAPELPMSYDFAYENPGAVLAAASAGTYSYAGPRVLSSSVSVRLTCAPNTNVINFMEHVDTNADGVPDTDLLGTYLPGDFRLQASATVYFDFESLVELPDQNRYIEPGPTRSLQFGNIYVELLDVTKGGRISIERGRHMISQPGYRMAESGVVYEIKTDAVYTGTVTIKMGISELYWAKQREKAKIFHCDAAMNCAEEDTTYDEGSAIIHPAHLSPFTLMVPIYDATPPQTALTAFGTKEELDGLVWVTTETYLNLAAEDSSNHDDISGPATTYYLLDALPTPECFATAYSSAATAGTCANPVYEGSFTLAEGSRTVRYLSTDRWGNMEEVRLQEFYVDGTPPVAELFAGTSPVADGAVGYVTEVDGLTVLYADPVSNGVASGVGAGYRLVDITPEECESSSRPVACDGAEYTGPFTLSPGTHTVYYAAVDNVGNLSAVKSAAITVQSTTAAGITAVWSGLAGDGDWGNPANWRDGQPPGAGDSAVIETIDTVIMTGDVRVHNLILGDAAGVSAPVLLVSTEVRSTGNWEIHRNSVLVQNTLNEISARAITVHPGGLVTHSANSGEGRYAVNLRVAGNLTVAAGAGISPVGRGYAAGAGPGSGTGAYYGAGGGAYGGAGSNGYSAQGGAAYGSLINPADPGSGGGNSSYYSGPSYGGAGGGVVTLNVGGVLRVDGVIAVDGLPGSGNNRGGGGSGGAISIKTAALAGVGSLSAGGGTGGDYGGGGGGGGRISIAVSGVNSSQLTIAAVAGNGYSGYLP
jgi:hypothetical protein